MLHLRRNELQSLIEKIDTFKKSYCERLQKWSTSISADELDALTLTLKRIEKESLGITQQIQTENCSDLFEEWSHLLRDFQRLTSLIEVQVNGIKANAKTALKLLGKGQQSLSGYRQAVTAGKTILDSNG